VAAIRGSANNRTSHLVTRALHRVRGRLVAGGEVKESLSAPADRHEEGTMPDRDQLFSDIDSMESERFAAHLAQDVTMRFGNAEPIHGRDAVRDAPLFAGQPTSAPG
jgi:hypothetical protein